MDKHNMHDLQRKASGFLGEGVRILKDGLKEAGRLLGATADATRLHIEKEQRTIGTHRDYHKLGLEVYRSLNGDARAATVKLTKPMRDIITNIKRAEDEIAGHKNRLSHMTVVGTPHRSAKVASGASTNVPRKAKRRASSARTTKKATRTKQTKKSKKSS